MAPFLINPYIYAEAGGCSGNLIDTTGLGGYWKFDGDYTDSSGNGHTLTAYNSPTFTTTDIKLDYTGNEGVEFDASTKQRCSASYSSDFDSSGGTFSFFAWVKVNSFATEGNPVLAGKRTGANGWRILPRANDILFSNTANASRSTTNSTGVWYHIGFTLNGSTIKIWKDGSQLGADVTGISSFDISSLLAINANPLNLTSSNGDLEIDEAYLFRRELSSSEISTLASSTCPLDA